ncbi:hypothetical protein H6P81_016982 [Aristolochia fimbriata]|uniref:Uncharacterized protein n=1 Tax=Aristolochia fimbriata TaxID=158543 RepID=A0AAV7DX41_ARIFI|nr:hypothetical protein H6P81_016982 [Aristolochia fimbriata]
MRMRRSREIVDGYEYIVHEGRIPTHLLGIVKNLPVAGKSSQPRPRPSCSVQGDAGSSQNQAFSPRAVVATPRGRSQSGVGEMGSGVEVPSVDAGSEEGSMSRRPMFVMADEALKFGDGLMKRFGFSDLKLSIVSPGLVSDRCSTVAPSRNTADCGREVVPVADTGAEVRISESKDEMVVSLVRKSPLATANSEALGDVEGDGRILSRKRKADVNVPCVVVGERVEISDSGVLSEKEDHPVGESENANENVAEKLHLEAAEKAEQPSIAVENGNSLGRCGEVAVDHASLSETSGKEECSSMPVDVTSSEKKRRRLPDTFNASKTPITRSRARAAKISDETDEDRGTKDGAKNNDSGENLEVSENGEKSILEKESPAREDPHISQSKGGSSGEKITDHEAGFNDPSSHKEGNSGQASTLASTHLTFLQAVKIMSSKTNRSSGDESILTLARRAGYTFSTYSARGT